jgi:hypothetical protein
VAAQQLGSQQLRALRLPNAIAESATTSHAISNTATDKKIRRIVRPPQKGFETGKFLIRANLAHAESFAPIGCPAQCKIYFAKYCRKPKSRE